MLWVPGRGATTHNQAHDRQVRPGFWEYGAPNAHPPRVETRR